MTEERSFEELQRELEEVVTKLERGDVAVDDAIALFTRGEELYRECVEKGYIDESNLEVGKLMTRVGHISTPDFTPTFGRCRRSLRSAGDLRRPTGLEKEEGHR